MGDVVNMQRLRKRLEKRRGERDTPTSPGIVIELDAAIDRMIDIELRKSSDDLAQHFGLPPAPTFTNPEALANRHGLTHKSPRPNPHSPMNTSPLMRPGRDAGSIADILYDQPGGFSKDFLRGVGESIGSILGRKAGRDIQKRLDDLDFDLDAAAKAICYGKVTGNGITSDAVTNNQHSTCPPINLYNAPPSSPKEPTT